VVAAERSPLLTARRERVLDAAEVVLAEVGVTATMDEIAEAAGIGRRTLFRYFPSREDLIAAAIERRYQRLDQEVFDDAHLEADDPDELIRRVLTTTHRVAAQMGKAHWQVAADREVLNGLGAAAEARQRARRRYVQRFTERLWELAGGPPPPPAWLADAFGLLESLFTYQALRLDFGRDEADIVDLTSRLMTDALHAALADAGLTTARPPRADGGSGPGGWSSSSATDRAARPNPPARR
jgi:AcrR family transcriptional regulator